MPKMMTYKLDDTTEPEHRARVTAFAVRFAQMARANPYGIAASIRPEYQWTAAEHVFEELGQPVAAEVEAADIVICLCKLAQWQDFIFDTAQSRATRNHFAVNPSSLR